MDLNSFETREKASAGIDFPLVINGATQYGDDGKPITFHTRGIDAPDIQALILKSRKTENSSPEAVRRADMELARAAVTGWSGNFTVKGEKVTFSKENIAIVLDNPVVRSAVLANVIERADFMNGSSD